MKGLKLAREYYQAYGKPMIEEKFPAYTNKVACGLVGEGSECFGCDDKISRDHDWGAGFCIWLNKNDFKEIGKELQKEYENLPMQFNGYKKLISKKGKQRIGVFGIESFYKKFTGISEKPRNYAEWLSIPENALATCLNGEVFEDNLGEFSRIRNFLLSYYPDEIRKIKIASKCISAGQSGQYNFLRALSRKDTYTLKYTEMQFCKDIISIAFLINRTYQPFYKWSYRKLQELPIMGQYIHEGIDYLQNTNDHEKKITIIELLASKVKEILKEENISNLTNNFLVDHGLHIYNTSTDENLKKYIKLG